MSGIFVSMFTHFGGNYRCFFNVLSELCLVWIIRAAMSAILLREVVSIRKVYGKKSREFLWLEIFVRFMGNTRKSFRELCGTVFGREK